MSFYFYLAPFSAQDPFIVNQEGASFDTTNFPAIHVFHFYYVKQLAKFFVRIRYQIKLEFVFFRKFS